MMRIGVISDTHQNRLEPTAAARLADMFAGVDIILHAGDLTSLQVLDDLRAPQVLAVCGNMDGYLVKESLPARRVLKLEGFNIGLVHGWGSPSGLAQRVRQEFTDVDCVVFGHSHTPFNQKMGGMLMFNPGSASSGPRGSGTVGILTLDKDITGRILEI